MTDVEYLRKEVEIFCKQHPELNVANSTIKIATSESFWIKAARYIGPSISISSSSFQISIYLSTKVGFLVNIYNFEKKIWRWGSMRTLRDCSFGEDKDIGGVLKKLPKAILKARKDLENRVKKQALKDAVFDDTVNYLREFGFRVGLNRHFQRITLWPPKGNGLREGNVFQFNLKDLREHSEEFVHFANQLQAAIDMLKLQFVDIWKEKKDVNS